jgi:hypothetical protein
MELMRGAGTWIERAGGVEDVFKGGYCPACWGHLIAHFKKTPVKGDPDYGDGKKEEFVGFVYPKRHAQKPVPIEVPRPFAEDYDEACRALDIPKASAALSRRLLQRVFHEHFKIKKRDLLTEIKTYLSTHKPPSYVAEQLDAVRTVGNFAAHPTKNKNTGQIVDVEPGEAAWLVELLDLLFDYWFVQPERQKQKKAALNSKLSAAGKPPMI